MSWGYGDDTDIVADAATYGDGERATMFSNDGLSSNNSMVKGLLEKGYAMKDVQDAIENVQSAIQRGMAPSEMPRGVLPHAEVVELYDEAAMQSGAPSSDEIEAQKANERDQAMEQARENLRGGDGSNMVGAAVGGALAANNPFLDMLSANSRAQLDQMSANNPQARMEMVHEANLLMDRTDPHISEGKLDMNATQDKSHGVNVGAGHGRDAGMGVV